MSLRILPLLSTQQNNFLSWWSADIQSKTRHAQTSCAPILGQAGLRARADLQLLIRDLIVVILQRYRF